MSGSTADVNEKRVEPENKVCMALNRIVFPCIKADMVPVSMEYSRHEICSEPRVCFHGHQVLGHDGFVTGRPREVNYHSHLDGHIGDCLFSLDVFG